MIPCPACGREIKILTATYDTPYFGRILITTINCECGFKHADSFIAEIKDPLRVVVEINENTLFSKVIRSTSGTVRIPELGLTLEPGPASQAFITNIEGILMRFEDIVEVAKKWNSDDSEKVERCEYILSKLRAAREGKETLTLIIEDPFGNSTVISDKAFMEKMSEEEASKLKTGLTIIDIAGDEILNELYES